jgi:hypothetical protein
MSIAITPNDTSVPSNLRALAYHGTAIRNNDKRIRVFKHLMIAGALKNSDSQIASKADSITDMRNVSSPNEVQGEGNILQRIRRAKTRTARFDDVSHAEQVRASHRTFHTWILNNLYASGPSAVRSASPWLHHRPQPRDHVSLHVYGAIRLRLYPGYVRIYTRTAALGAHSSQLVMNELIVRIIC